MCGNFACAIHDLSGVMADILPMEFTICLGGWHCVVMSTGNGLVCLPEVEVNADTVACALLTYDQC